MKSLLLRHNSVSGFCRIMTSEHSTAWVLCLLQMDRQDCHHRRIDLPTEQLKIQALGMMTAVKGLVKTSSTSSTWQAQKQFCRGSPGRQFRRAGSCGFTDRWTQIMQLNITLDVKGNTGYKTLPLRINWFALWQALSKGKTVYPQWGKTV